MNRLTPLRFQPLFKTALWGGVQLQQLLAAPVAAEPTGEAWLLSDQGEHQSVVSEGPWAGTTLRQLMQQASERILGRRERVHRRFPLLLKLIDAAQPLSIQVHPTDELARTLEANTESNGKTEAWYVLRAEPQARIYAGLQPNVTVAQLQTAVDQQRGVEDYIVQHPAQVNDCFFLPAGTVHAIGGGLLLFEVQQTSDITYRLSDWGRVDPTTGQPRELHLTKGLKCIDTMLGPCTPIVPSQHEDADPHYQALVQCAYFTMARWDAQRTFAVGSNGTCRMLVGIGGTANVMHSGQSYPLRFGEVLLIPAEVGCCTCVPEGRVSLLECGVP